MSVFSRGAACPRRAHFGREPGSAVSAQSASQDSAARDFRTSAQRIGSHEY